MRKSIVTASLAAGAFCAVAAGSALAAAPDLERMQQQMNELLYQNQQLTKRIAEIDKETRSSETGKDKKEEGEDSIAAKINDHVTLGGLIEIEMSLADDSDNDSSQGVNLSKAELTLEAEATEWAKGTFGVEWDDEDDKITINEAFVVLGGSKDIPTTLQAGRFVLPFGAFAANTVSDPLTKEAFETKEDAVMVGIERNGFAANVYAFNGDTNEGGDEESIDHYGAALGYTLEQDTLSVSAGLSYINSIFDADGLSDNYSGRAEEAAGLTGFSFDPDHSYLNADYVGGVALHASVTIAGFTAFGEYITAVDDYEMDFVEGGVAGTYRAKPSAYHMELAYKTELSGYQTTFALGYSAGEDMGGFLPESRLALAAGVELTKGFVLAAELTHDTDYAEIEGGTDEDANTMTMKLAYEF